MNTSVCNPQHIFYLLLDIVFDSNEERNNQDTLGLYVDRINFQNPTHRLFLLWLSIN